MATDINQTSERKRRQGEALRANLARRKDQTRRREQAAESCAADPPALQHPTAPSAESAAESLAMSVLPDTWIRKMAIENGMIEPFTEKLQREGVISYGLSSYGYDARVSREFKIFTNVDSAVVDPKDFSHQSFVDRETEICVIPPNSFALARTVEYFRIPRDTLAICLGKSTYARCGIIVNVTPLEPEWEGHVTLEFSNTTPLPAKIYANEGACQFIFLKADSACETSYRDRSGKYQGQRGVTLPKL